MIFQIHNNKDATIYERYPSVNTGLDAMLDISKEIITSGSTNYSYNSRIILDFDFTTLRSLLSTQTLASASYSLNLYTTEANEIPVAYTLYAYPLSQSWNMGTGRFTNQPTSSNGVSWTYRQNSTDSTTKWPTSSFGANATGSWVVTPGGGVWYTSSAYVATQSFDYSTTDVSMNVTDTVRAWISGTLPNYGFIVKKGYTDEASSDIFNSIKFFSRDTHTIYSPKLQVKWIDAVYQTSQSIVSFDKEVVVSVQNVRDQYKETDKPRFNITARPKFPIMTFQTASNWLDVYQLPYSSSYSILDARTGESVIPFDDIFTQISADGNGSYFRLFLDGLQPERYYRIAIKTKPSSNEEYVFDNNWIFKVTR